MIRRDRKADLHLTIEKQVLQDFNAIIKSKYNKKLNKSFIVNGVIKKYVQDYHIDHGREPYTAPGINPAPANDYNNKMQKTTII